MCTAMTHINPVKSTLQVYKRYATCRVALFQVTSREGSSIIQRFVMGEEISGE